MAPSFRLARRHRTEVRRDNVGDDVYVLELHTRALNVTSTEHTPAKLFINKVLLKRKWQVERKSGVGGGGETQAINWNFIIELDFLTIEMRLLRYFSITLKKLWNFFW